MKKARAKWFNVYEKPNGERRRSLEQDTRKKAERQSALAIIASKSRTLYRIRVRRYLGDAPAPTLAERRGEAS